MFKEFYCECNGSMTSDAIYATTHRIITEDRNQAYTSLVEGIKAQVENINGEGSVFDDFATDILENVVKPLYGKE